MVRAIMELINVTKTLFMKYSTTTSNSIDVHINMHNNIEGA
jgi:hypothetical protein